MRIEVKHYELKQKATDYSFLIVLRNSFSKMTALLLQIYLYIGNHLSHILHIELYFNTHPSLIYSVVPLVQMQLLTLISEYVYEIL